jgi:hypothetical protein
MVRISKIAVALLLASLAAPAFAQATSGQAAKTAADPKAIKPATTTVAPAAPAVVAPNLPATTVAPKVTAPAAPTVRLPAKPEPELDEIVRPNC